MQAGRPDRLTCGPTRSPLQPERSSNGAGGEDVMAQEVFTEGNRDFN